MVLFPQLDLLPVSSDSLSLTLLKLDYIIGMEYGPNGQTTRNCHYTVNSHLLKLLCKAL